ncbi:MAG: hypothetical protein EAZ95_08410 [Bacteroidetes bacterium]|nr:MAG: hypothetical protein EAZ95_08410 [Bacteroidota bacterium]
MNPQIAKAIEHLRTAYYTGYFDVMDTMPIPTQHQNAYYTQKHIFTSGQPLPPFFAQSLDRLAKEIANTIGGQTDTDKDSKVPKFLTTAPFMPTIFVGRQAELEAVHHRLFGGENFLMLVNGQGGIGKTTFASKYWAQYQNEYSHLAFLYAENGIAQAILALSACWV